MAALSLSCGGGAALEGDEAGECSDGADNDGDGAFDCDDLDCAGSTDCETDNTGSSSTTTTNFEVPTEVGELGAFLFFHFDDANTSALQGGLKELETILVDVDFSRPYSDNTWTMPQLLSQDLGTVTPPADVDALQQVPVALPFRSALTLTDSLIPITEPNQICIAERSVIWEARTFLTDAACFRDRSCEYLDVVDETRVENVLARVWLDRNKTYRWIDVKRGNGDPTEMLMGRQSMSRRYDADGGGNSWDQSYTLDVYMPDPSQPNQTLRWTSVWSSVTISGLTDDAYANLTLAGVQDTFVFADEFADGSITSCQNDRDEPKP